MRKIISVIIVSFIVVFISGCKTAHIAFPEGNSKTEFFKYEVKGSLALFSGTLAFGEYTVKWTSSGIRSKKIKSSIFGNEYMTLKEHDYTVTISGANMPQLNGKCRSEAEMEIEKTKETKRITSISKKITSNVLKCSFESSDNQLFDMMLRQKDNLSSPAGDMTGFFKGNNINLEITSARRFEGSLFESYSAIGYFIFDEGKLIGAVERVNSGTVYIARGITKNKIAAVANIAAALLKYHDVTQGPD